MACVYVLDLLTQLRSPPTSAQASSPACTELESIVMNWLGKMIGLPDSFLHLPGTSMGGGVIQTTASEATLVCLLAGRTMAITRFHEHTPGLQDAEINARLVAYCSDQAHSSVEKAALIGLVRMRFIESDDQLSLRGDALREAIEEDIKQGLIPFWVSTDGRVGEPLSLLPPYLWVKATVGQNLLVESSQHAVTNQLSKLSVSVVLGDLISRE